jgi:glycine/D-amino acid oxidase-like deaminating enzyme
VRVSSELPARAELVVVGAGIVGAATAFYAARAGIQPLVVERRPLAASLTTAVAAGGYRLQLDHREELDLVRRTLDLIEGFADITGQTEHDPHQRRAGYLWMTSDPATAERQRELVARQRGWGVDGVELLDAGELRGRFPWVGPSVIQARFRQDDGLIEPRAIALGLLARQPVALSTSVTGFETAGGRLAAVVTDRGRIACERAVIACGPLSGPVAAPAGVLLPVTATRRQRVVVWNARELPEGAPMTIDEDTTTHFRPVPGGAYLLYPDSTEPAAEPIEQVPADPAFAVRLLDPESPIAMARTVPAWADVWRGPAQWVVQAGQYTMTPDQRPLIGETELPGLYVNTGYCGHGVMGGPGGSQLLADLLAGALPASENPFRLDREFVAAHQAF